MLKSAILKIQNRVNECIICNLKAWREDLSLKLQYLNNEQRKTFLLQELFKITDLLVQLRKNRAIDSLFEYVDNPNFLWESAFIENLSSGEKKKYQNFDLLSFDFNQYAAQNHFYDDSLPYFSKIVQFVVLYKYIHVLKDELEFYQSTNYANDKKLNLVDEKPVIKKTFEGNFDKQQIEILTDCINKARIFIESVSSETVQQIFKCELTNPLRVKNNRRLAYFFVSLDDRSLITHHWQSVCETNQLFLSSMKCKVLKQTDLSTATNECRDFPPKDSAIIDKYIKELKKH
jgi:hypothetical protein